MSAAALAATLLASPLAADPPGPAAPPAADPRALAGTSWELRDLPGKTLQAARRPTLRFGRRQAQGFDGCKTFSETYILVAGAVVIPSPVSSLLDCPAERLQEIQAFRSAVEGARSFHADGTTLELRTADGEVLASLAALPPTLEGTAWRATDVNTGQRAVSSVLAGSTLTLEFSDDGRASGSAGCSRYTAAYRHEDTRLVFQAPSVKRKKCAQPELAAQEASFLAALSTVAWERLDGERLELRAADGSLAIQLTRAEGKK